MIDLDAMALIAIDEAVCRAGCELFLGGPKLGSSEHSSEIALNLDQRHPTGDQNRIAE